MTTRHQALPSRFSGICRGLLLLGLLLAGAREALAATADPDGASPSWTANWIWDNTNGAAFTYMRLRKAVTLSSVPSTLPTRISCDSKYSLWVNGTVVVRDGNAPRGPTQNDGYFDTVDLAPYLHTGSNVIAALVEFFNGGGGGANDYTNSGMGGFILQADSGGSAVIQSDSTWKVSLDTSFTNGSSANHTVEGPITFDARVDDGSWTQAGFNDAAWAAATTKGVPPVAPWGYLWDSKLLLLMDYGLANYVSQSTNGTVTTGVLPYNAQIAPAFQLGASTQAGLTIVMNTTNPLNGTKISYITKAGAQTWEAPGMNWMSGEAVTYNIPAGVEVVALQYRQSGYNTTFVPLTTSDTAINTLMTKAQRNAYLAIRHQYMDCADRERGQWIGDMTSDIGQDFYAFGSSIYPLTRKGFMQALFFTGNDSANIMFSLSPPGTYGYNLENQTLPVLTTQGIWMYYQFSGETAVLNYTVDYATRIFQNWNLDADGLPEDKVSWWTDGVNSPSNAVNAPKDTHVFQVGLYYSGLQATKQMIQVIGGHATQLSWINARMASIEQNFNRVFWTGSEYRSPGYTADTDERGAAWAVITGLADSAKFSQIRGTLTTHFHASVFSEQWCEQALYVMGFPDDAMSRMKSQYAAMIASPISTLWENFPPAGETQWNYGNGTMNHGWAGGSLQMLKRYGAGIVPLTPGSSSMRVEPQLGTLSNLSTTVATLKGDLAVAYTQTTNAFSATLTEPSGMTNVHLYVPTKGASSSGTVSVNGVTVVQNGAATGSVGGVSFVGVGGLNNGAYHFTVTPGTWNFSVNGTSTPPTVPAAPTGLTASANTSSQITLSWTAVSGATGYNLYRGSSAGGESTTVINGGTPITGTTYANSGLTASTTYYYIVKAVNSVGSSGASNEASATTQAVTVTLVGNGGFEVPALASATFAYTPSGAPWTFTGNSGIENNGSAWGASAAPEGVQAAFLQSNGPLGVISQTLTITTAQSYQLSLKAAQRSGQVQPLRITIDSQVLATAYAPAGNAFESWTSTPVTLTAGSHALTIAATDTSGDKSTFIDDVRLVATASPAVPTIATQPSNQTVTTGQTATFTVVASGTGTLSYQWKRGSVPVGGNNATLTLSNAQSVDAGAYTVTVSNSAGGVISNSATLTVNSATATPPTVATAAGGPAAPVSGTTAALSVLGGPAGSESGYTYTWSVVTAPTGGTASFTPKGSNAAKNTTATVNRVGAWQVQVAITNPANGTTTISGPVSIAVNATFASISVSGPTSVKVNGTAQFSAQGNDQFAQALATQPTFTWSATSGTVSSAGLFTASTAVGTGQVTATSGGKNGQATIGVTAAGTASPAASNDGGTKCGMGSGIAVLVLGLLTIAALRIRPTPRKSPPQPISLRALPCRLVADRVGEVCPEDCGADLLVGEFGHVSRH